MGEVGYINYVCDSCGMQRFTCCECGEVTISDGEGEDDMCLDCWHRTDPKRRAANEMYEALKEITDRHVANLKLGGFSDDVANRALVVVNARAAIAKAEGKQDQS